MECEDWQRVHVMTFVKMLKVKDLHHLSLRIAEMPPWDSRETTEAAQLLTCMNLLLQTVQVIFQGYLHPYQSSTSNHTSSQDNKHAQWVADIATLCITSPVRTRKDWTSLLGTRRDTCQSWKMSKRNETNEVRLALWIEQIFTYFPNVLRLLRLLKSSSSELVSDCESGGSVLRSLWPDPFLVFFLLLSPLSPIRALSSFLFFIFFWGVSAPAEPALNPTKSNVLSSLWLLP